ncbi:hypothetical protein [Cylindrospermopsis raciborskii]|uniref:Uncharacterized protein n=1 Tax=Cylindrospermopsis raciborskii CS-506_A TaxID=2585140 RepID=A0A838WJA2_9CYAN|nr:hypothetical protein [Cylindrospermopsis raciborskii]MBA4449786.1 hypothetical protein [Cylindrospermopsis raciborskii CS-506_D]MBA4456406.1 hypothetical protein [Cylindrospermopsis raciborskii CS-506_B]MBA4465751.1 hypothetical protein [Cylindrospermopsis raciborskii CS-506_A]
MGDRIALPTGDCEALATRDRKGLATWRLFVGETGLKAKVGLKPTSFVVGNRRLG